MPRLRAGRSNYDLIVDGVGLMLGNRPTSKSKDRRPISLQVRYSPETVSSDQLNWDWTNGAAGAGYGEQTERSYAAGGSSYGEFVWLRKDGKAMGAGKLTEIAVDASVSGSGARILDAFEWGANQDLYLTSGTRYVIKLASGTGSTTTIIDLGAGVGTASTAIFSGSGTPRAYVSCGTTSRLFQFSGGAFTAVTDDVKRSRLATVYWVLGEALATGGAAGAGGSGGYRLIGTDTSGTGFYHVAGDPGVSADWSSLTTVGDANFPIQNVVVDENGETAFFGKPSGLHAVNSLGYAPNLSKWFELAYNPSNCGASVAWGGAVWTIHEQGLVRIPITGERQSIAEFYQFGYGASSDAPIFGRPRWLCPSPEGLYVAYFDGTHSYIGHLRVLGGVPHWSMAECVIRNQEVTWMRQTSPASGPQLMIGTIDTSNRVHLYSQSLPVSGDPEVDLDNGLSFEPAPEWNLTLSQFGAPGTVPMVIRRISTEIQGLGDGNTVEIQVATDDGTATTQGTATTSPRWTGAPITGNVKAVNAQVKLLAHNQNSGAPIQISSVSLRYSPRPEQTRFVTYPCMFGENVTLRNGSQDKRDPGTVLSSLEYKQRGGVISFTDPLGRQFDGLVEGGFNELYVEEAVSKGFTVYCDVTISTTRDVARFDIDAFDIALFS